MELIVHRESFVIKPQNDQDKAFLEDTLGFSKNGVCLKIERIDDIALGFNQKDYVLKVSKENEERKENKSSLPDSA